MIIVDDASDDGSANLLRGLEAPNASLEVVRNEALRGLTFSRARAADLAQGRYLAFLDAHCALSPGWLSGLEAALKSIDGAGIAVPLIYELDPETWTIDTESVPCAGCTLTDPFLEFFWTEPSWMEGRLCSCTIGGGAWMLSREWYRHLGGLDRGMVAWGGENIVVGELHDLGLDHGCVTVFFEARDGSLEPVVLLEKAVRI